MPAEPVLPRKLPRQARSKATVEVVLEAAARVLARESLQGFNTNKVAELAGVSVGSLYQYFPNKSALVAALIERKQARLAASVDERVAALMHLPLGEAIHGLARLAVQQQFEQPLLAAALDHEERRLSLGPAMEAAEGRMAAAVRRLLARHRAALPKALPARAARDCLAIARALVDASDAATPAARSGLVRRVERALMGYLTYVAAEPAAHRR